MEIDSNALWRRLERRDSDGPIGAILVAELLFAGCCATGIGWVWGVHTGISAAIGAGAYLLPYALVYIAFFYQFTKWNRQCFKHEGQLVWSSFSKDVKKQKRVIVGSFILAEFAKIGLTLGSLIATAIWYRHADWSVVLISFAVTIQVNWVALWVVLRRTA